MNHLEKLKDWHHRHLNETLEEHDMWIEGNIPWNVLAVIHQENEREDSAILPCYPHPTALAMVGMGMWLKQLGEQRRQLRRLGEQG